MTILSLVLSTTFALAPANETAPEPASTNQDADEAALVGSEEGVSVYEFADDTLTGEHLKPDGSLIPWRRPTRHGSLINLRGHFMRELINLGRDL